MPNPILDYLEYRKEKVTDFFAIINPINQNVLGVKKSSESKYLFAHSESEELIKRLSNRFIEDNVNLDPQAFVIQFDEPNNSEFTYSEILGCLINFQEFHDLPVGNITIGLSCTNDYSYEGQLEVSLWYKYDNQNTLRDDTEMMVFDKWTVSSSKELFRFNSLDINPNGDFFEGRDYLIDSCIEDIYKDFNYALSKLKEFIQDAHRMLIRHDFLVPVFLNIRDKNRSVTALKNSESRSKSLEKEIEKVKEIIGPNRNNWTYLDFLQILSAFKFEGKRNYEDRNRIISYQNFKKFQTNLSASQDYKDLLNTVDSLKSIESRNEFEEEQLRLFNEIRNII